MCILLAAFCDHPHYDLVIAANRDEFYARPSAPAAQWDDCPQILAGRDLEAGGTWLGIDRTGRFAAVTNVRNPQGARGSRSRGLLVREFLAGERAAQGQALALGATALDYAGVNLMLADRHALVFWSNVDNRVRALAPGIYGLSNAELDTEWPKVSRLKAAYARQRTRSGDALITALFAILRDERGADDESLPDTGIGLERERLLAPIFILGGGYGTRCSTVVLRTPAGEVSFVERRFDAHGHVTGESRFQIQAQAA